MPNHKPRLTILALLSSAVLISVASTAAAQADGKLAVLEERALKQAAAIVAPSIVRIETVGGLERVDEILAGTGPTTGVVVSADGYIITSSFNFAAKPSSILVTLPDGRRFAARQVASDNLKMLTLIKIDAENLTPAPAAPRDSVRVGQWAIALGRTYDTPFPSMSVGIVSALNRIWGKAIQTDAKVSPVNYGGPLVDIEGRVLGVLVPLSPLGKSDAAGVEWYDAGIGFAIPMSDIYAVLDQLKAEKDLHSGLLGITFQTKDLYSTPPMVDHVWYNSPAQKAGIKSGDTIVEVNGAATTRISQVRHALGNAYAGDKIALSVNRDGETIKVDFELAAKLEPYESAFLGILPERLSTVEPAVAAAPRWRGEFVTSMPTARQPLPDYSGGIASQNSMTRRKVQPASYATRSAARVLGRRRFSPFCAMGNPKQSRWNYKRSQLRSRRTYHVLPSRYRQRKTRILKKQDGWPRRWKPTRTICGPLFLTITTPTTNMRSWCGSIRRETPWKPRCSNVGGRFAASGV